MTPYYRFLRGSAISLCTVLWTAAFASIGASAYLGFAYGQQFGLPFGVIAVCAEIFKPVSMHLGLQYLGHWRTSFKAPLFLFIASACLIYSLMAELAISATARGDSTATRAAASLGAQDARTDRQRYLAELAAIKPSRPLAELETLVSTARPRCEIHVSTGRRDTVCSKDPKLLAELARAKRRVELEDRIAKLQPSVTVATVAPDPLADALVLLYGDATGAKVSAEAVSKRLPLLPTFLIEICSAFGINLAMAGTAWIMSLAPRRTQPILRPSKVDRPIVHSAIKMDGLKGCRGPSFAKVTAERDLIAYIAAHKSVPSQQFLCDRWGVGSKQTVSNWLRDWETKGLITRYVDGRVKVTTGNGRSNVDSQMRTIT